MKARKRLSVLVFLVLLVGIGFLIYTWNIAKPVDCTESSLLPEVKIDTPIFAKVGEPLEIEVKNLNG